MRLPKRYRHRISSKAALTSQSKYVWDDFKTFGSRSTHYSQDATHREIKRTGIRLLYSREILNDHFRLIVTL